MFLPAAFIHILIVLYNNKNSTLTNYACISFIKAVKTISYRWMNKNGEEQSLSDPLQRSSNIRVKIRVSNSPELHKTSKIDASLTQEFPSNDGFLPNIKKTSNKFIDSSDYGDQVIYHTRRYMKQYTLIEK